MKIFNKLQKIEISSLALGFFDGVHSGHQKVIKTALNKPGTTAVITFKQSPAEYFSGKKIELITTIEERLKRIEALGVDYIFELDFTKELAKISAEEYIEMLVEYFKPKDITTGFNHTFGRNKSGNPKLLENLQQKYNYEYNQIPPKKINNEIISSTKIRELLTQGEIEKANLMLGYNFTISGEVIKGNQLGRTIGFPTANTNYPKNIISIPYGVYSTKCLNKKSMTNYGIKPTLNNTIPVVETHILNFDENIYNNNIEIQFIKKLRNEKKFNSLEELKQQIHKDIQEC